MATHDLNFPPIADPERVGLDPDPHSFTLFGAARSPRPAPLLFAGTARPETEADHRYRADLPPAAVYAVTGHELRAGGLLVRDGSVFWRDDCLPSYLRDVLQPGASLPGAWAHGLDDPQLRPIDLDRPCAVPTHPNFVYGHFLLEMLPKLWLLDWLRRYGCRFAVALPTTMPAWMQPFVALFVDDADIVRYDPRRERVRAPAFLAPAMLNVGYYLHPAMNVMAEDVAARALAAPGAPAPPAGRRLFLSRRSYEGGAHSVLEDAAAIEDALRQDGFEAIRPEELSLRDQIATYRSAAVMVGEYGSALHNALFAPHGSAVVAINPFNTVQSRIAALRGQPYGIVEPVGGPRNRLNADPSSHPRVRIDIGALRGLLAAMAPAAPPPVAPTPAPSTLMAYEAEETPDGASPASYLTMAFGMEAAPVPTRDAAADSFDTLPRGEYLATLEGDRRVGHTLVVAPQEPRDRGGFLFATSIDPNIAPFGRLFSAPDGRRYLGARMICTELRDAMLIGADGLIAVAGKVVGDTANSVEAWRAESLVADPDDGGQVRLKRRLRRPGRTGDLVFCGFSGGWRTIDCWLLECLPRLQVFLILRRQFPALRLAMPKLPAGSLQERTLQVLAIEPRDVLTVGPDDVVAPTTLWALNGIDKWCPPSLCRDAAHALGAMLAAAPASPATRIHLASQAGPPRVANRDDIAPFLAARGFRTIRPTEVSLDTLVAAMAGARVVVGETGVGLSAALFCGPGTPVIELFNPAGPQPTIWSVAALCGLPYGYVVGRHAPVPGQDRAADGNSPYAVDLEQLAGALAMVGGDR